MGCDASVRQFNILKQWKNKEAKIMLLFSCLLRSTAQRRERVDHGAVQGKRDGGDLSKSFPAVRRELLYGIFSNPASEVCVLQEFSCPSRKASVNKNNKSR